MSQGSWFWKEAGCRKDSLTLVGHMKATAKLVTTRKVQKSTGFTIVQVGMKSGAKSQRLAGTGRHENVEEGMHVAQRYCYACSK